MEVIEGTPTNSVSIAFKVGESVSLALYDQDGGHVRVLHAITFVEVLWAVYGDMGGQPPSQRNPNAILVEYIRAAHVGLSEDLGGLHLGRDGTAADNSGSGHWVIDINGDLIAQAMDVARSAGKDDRFLFELLWGLRDTDNGC